VRRAALMNIHAQVRHGAHQASCSAGVVEVNMGQQHRAQVRDRDAMLGEAGFEVGQRAGRAGVHDRRLVAEQQVGTDHMRLAEVEVVDQADGGRQAEVVIHMCSAQWLGGRI
jgi:hypothetical protein